MSYEQINVLLAVTEVHTSFTTSFSISSWARSLVVKDVHPLLILRHAAHWDLQGLEQLFNIIMDSYFFKNNT